MESGEDHWIPGTLSSRHCCRISFTINTNLCLCVCVVDLSQTLVNFEAQLAGQVFVQSESEINTAWSTIGRWPSISSPLVRLFIDAIAGAKYLSNCTYMGSWILTPPKMVASNNEQSQTSFKTIVLLPECWKGFAWSKVGKRWGIVRGEKRMHATRFD